MKKKYSARVRYAGEVASVPISPDVSLLENFVRAKLPIGRSCNGEGICTTCRVFIIRGEVTKPQELEEVRRVERDFAENERLSCQCKALSLDLDIEIP